MVGTTREMNSWNSRTEFFFKLLNNLGVIHIVTNMFQTPILESMHCPSIHSSYVNWKVHWNYNLLTTSFGRPWYHIYPYPLKSFHHFKVEVKLSLFEKTIWRTWRKHLSSFWMKIKRSLQKRSLPYTLAMKIQIYKFPTYLCWVQINFIQFWLGKGRMVKEILGLTLSLKD